ncbi:MAG TPA: presqualene diphosphate synthase HpnD [Caulobacteraceae bacterium]
MSADLEQAAGAAGAAGSSFYAAMRLMPRPERAAMFAIYAFCRKVDDIADEPGPSRAERRAALEAWRADLAALFGGEPTGRTADLAEPVLRYGLEREDFLAVVDGMEMDVDEDIRAPAFEKLDLYCDRVASAVGRLSVRIFGMDADPGVRLAHHLGRALQLTNILRDLDEDAAIGRLYLPAEALSAVGVETADPQTVLGDPAIDQACRWLAAIAHRHYREADLVMAARPAGRLRTPRLMSAVYGQILAAMEAEGWSAPRRRAKIGRGRLMWIILTRGLF